MTKPCPACEAETRDGLLCRDCTRYLRRNLLSIPDLMLELDTTYTRTAQFGSGNGKAPSAEVALPFDWNAAHVRDDVMHTLISWLAELTLADESRKIRAVPRTIVGWYLDHIDQLRGHKSIAELVDEIGGARSSLVSAIDIPQPTIPAGTCPICSKPVRALEDQDEAVCRYCARAGIESVLTVDRAQVGRWAQAGARLVTRTVAIDAAKHLGRTISPETFRSWVKRGKLADRPDPKRPGRRLYRFSDVLELADRSKAEAG